MNKFELGWNSALDRVLPDADAEHLVRIIEKHKSSFRGLTITGESINCYLRGKLLQNGGSADLPVVGDWCVTGNSFVDESNERAATIESLVPRWSKLSRLGAGTETAEQILAANIDFVFVVTAANADFSINRMRRYVLLARAGNTQPVLVISKVDLLTENELTALIDQVHEAFPDLPYACTSSIAGAGLDVITSTLSVGQTGVFIGSSGVGKSTLVNSLIETAAQKITATRERDDKGRHTTSAAGLFVLASGGMIIDTAGLREVQILADTNDLQAMNPSIQALAALCKFADCEHQQEPGCAVQQALDEGSLGQAEFDSYLRLQRELIFNRRKLDERLDQEVRRKWKRIAMDSRRRKQSR